MKKFIAILFSMILVGFSILLGTVPAVGDMAVKETWQPGNYTRTEVGNSVTANSWYLLNGTKGTQVLDRKTPDGSRPKFTPRAHRIYEETGVMNLYFGNSNSPAAYAMWPASWGPYESNELYPAGGKYICLSGTATVIQQSKY